eukprot:GHUV01026450.1.p1 GENE.GHUV01026450.1~~GHUV01026450.1.p1  ORF type:complete len:360 (+),score=55.78 GHUV01026450.1:835-1914(+)
MSLFTRLGISRALPSWIASALGVTGLVAGGLGKAAMDHIPAHHLSHKPPLWGARFDNPWPTWPGDKGLTDVWKFVREVRRAKVPQHGYLSTNRNATLEECSRAFPLVKPDAAALADPPAAAVQAMWVGHATMLVQMEGLSFITDPVFSQRASPVQFMGPQRCVQPAIEPEHPAFPKLDFVLISHNHYDHLDTGSVNRLFRRFGNDLAWYVPLGLKSWFKGQGIQNVTELDWWQQVQHPGSKVNLVLTPAQHWSARGGYDRRATLWGGWAVLGPQLKFWFAGDTGYCPVFKEIGERLGPFDLSAIPIGAYQPRNFMRAQHIGPDEAVTVHKEVRSWRSIGIHCCTFCLTLGNCSLGIIAC